jgi:hypothetical protein
MTNESAIEQRLANLESAVSELQRRINGAAPSEDWLEKVSGSVTDEEAFLEALEYGREFRQADKPKDEDWKNS